MVRQIADFMLNNIYLPFVNKNNNKDMVLLVKTQKCTRNKKII